MPSLPQQPEPPAETLPPAIDITVNTVAGFSPEEAPSPSPEAGSLRRPTPELAPQSATPEPLLSGPTSSEPKVSIRLSLWTLRGQAQLHSVWPG